MSQPQVLKHSHSLFKKRDELQHIEQSPTDSGSESTKTCSIGQHHPPAGEPSDLPKREQTQAEDETSDEEEVSGSALEEELDRAEFDPFIGHGIYSSTCFVFRICDH